MIRVLARYFVSFVVVLTIFAIATVLFGQEQSVGMFEIRNGGELVGSGSAVVVGRLETSPTPTAGFYDAILATANHVVKDKAEGESWYIVYSNGAKVKVNRLLAVDEANDLALVAALCPDDVLPLALRLEVEPYAEIKVIGYPGRTAETGVGKFLRRYKGRSFCDAEVRPGYSGGAVTCEGQLCGIISGGWMWLENERGDTNATWPTTGGNAVAIVALAESLAAK